MEQFHLENCHFNKLQGAIKILPCLLKLNAVDFPKLNSNKQFDFLCQPKKNTSLEDLN